MGPAREAAASGAARGRRARATRVRLPALPSWSLARHPAPARPTPPPTREGERAASSVQQLLDDHAIAPVTGELAVPLVDADDAESTGLVQPEARGVLGKDARDELPHPPRGVDVAERVQRRPPGPGGTRGAGHVDRVLGDPRIRGPGPVRARGRPRDHAPVALDHDRRIALALVGQLPRDLFRGSRLRLERRHAVGDALVVDGGDGRRVLPGRRSRGELHYDVTGPRASSSARPRAGTTRSRSRTGVGGWPGSAGSARARRARRRRRDRKSTRLNSSHLVISYAVFCLKKKN